MSTTTTINSDEIEAVAARIDSGGQLDEHDKAVLRALFVLAGEAASQTVVDDDVAGFAFDAGPQSSVGLSLTFTLPQKIGDGNVGGAFTSGQSLSRSCCTGKHIVRGVITTR